MTATDKTTAKTEQLIGAAKEAAGRVVGNERMTGTGRSERAKGDLRQAAEKTKDALRR
ncbi:CsbD family protein [Streptomyces sp. NPDC048650]|uniref:CsbD family protein n=1 Tax=unclassified Streptomyces TaxID=2593676 RepID=UPI003722E61E